MLLRFVRDVEVWLATVKKYSGSEAPGINMDAIHSACPCPA